MQLKINEAAIERAIKKLPGMQVYGGQDGLLDPGLVDILDPAADFDRWQPACRRSKSLLLATEACRDLDLCASQFVDRPDDRRRVAKQMTVPAINLVEKVLDLLAMNNDPSMREYRSTWPDHDQQAYTRAGRRMKKASKGPVRQVRRKLAAHIDPEEAITAATALSTTSILEAIGDALLLLCLSFNYPARYFTWIRPVDSRAGDSHRFVQLLCDYPLAPIWRTDLAGNAEEIVAIFVATDPRRELQSAVLGTITAYNEMVRSDGTGLPVLGIAPPRPARPDGQDRLSRQPG